MQGEEALRLAYFLLALATVICLTGLAFLVLAILRERHNIHLTHHLADVAKEAMENVVAATDLPAAMYVRERRENHKPAPKTTVKRRVFS